MKLHFLGAAQTVTGSQYLLEVNGRRILMECGLYQGRRKDTYERNLNFLFDPAKIDAVILSHAHIDHSGNLPNLVKQGFYGPIFATDATVALADIMLLDSAHIQEADVVYVNKKNLRRGEELVEPLYTIEDALQVKPLFSGQPYDKEFKVIEGVTAKFVDAGHILGSAAIILDIEERGKKTRLWFSGDIGRYNLPLMRDPVFPDSSVDYLMMECTYGDKPHRDPEAAYVEFRDLVRRTVNRGGKVIIPAFAVGRTQELVYDLNRMISNGEISPLPVYVDSPLAVNASQIFFQFPNLFDEETQAFIRLRKHPALNFNSLTYIHSVEESKKLNDRHEPMIIISASGMAETGRILHHLRNNIENPRNSIAIVSWQAPDTLGRRLAEGMNTVRIFGQLYERRAEVATIGGLSAHAGQDVLLNYAKAARGKLKEIFLVHSEENTAAIFEAKMKEAGIGPVSFPARTSFVEI